MWRRRLPSQVNSMLLLCGSSTGAILSPRSSFHASSPLRATSAEELERERKLREQVSSGSRGWGTFQRLQQQAQEAAQKATANNQSTSSTTSGSGASTGGSGTSNTPFGGQAPPGMPNFGNWDFNSPQQRRTRFWAGLVIFGAGLVLMKRAGWTGDFSDFKVPYWAIGSRQQAQWMLYSANIDANRRHEIKRMFDDQKLANPNLDFFAFVDSVEPFWAWSNTYSKDYVIGCISQAIANGNAMQLFQALRTNTSGGWFFSAPKDAASRVDGLVRALENTMGPFNPQMALMQPPPMYNGWGNNGAAASQNSFANRPPPPMQPPMQPPNGIYYPPPPVVGYGGMPPPPPSPFQYAVPPHLQQPQPSGAPQQVVGQQQTPQQSNNAGPTLVAWNPQHPTGPYGMAPPPPQAPFGYGGPQHAAPWNPQQLPPPPPPSQPAGLVVPINTDPLAVRSTAPPPPSGGPSPHQVPVVFGDAAAAMTSGLHAPPLQSSFKAGDLVKEVDADRRSDAERQAVDPLAQRTPPHELHGTPVVRK